MHKYVRRRGHVAVSFHAARLARQIYIGGRLHSEQHPVEASSENASPLPKSRYALFPTRRNVIVAQRNSRWKFPLAYHLA